MEQYTCKIILHHPKQILYAAFKTKEKLEAWLKKLVNRDPRVIK